MQAILARFRGHIFLPETTREVLCDV